MVKEVESIVITGACGDIGEALTREFARVGVRRLALCDLVAPDAAQFRFADIVQGGVDVLYRQVDVTDAEAIHAFIEEAGKRFGGLDLCIGNAGIVERGMLVDLPVDAWRRTLDVNLTGCFLTAQAAARVMKGAGRGGHIVLISSWTQDVPRETIGAYCASKGGLKMLARCLALELGRDRIRVNLVAPGFVDAGLTGQNLKKHPQRRQAMEASIPLGDLLSADELARAVRLLCSQDAGYCTGVTWLLDGGSSLCYP